MPGAYHVTDYMSGRERRLYEQVVVVMPSVIDEVLGTRTAAERTTLLRRFRDAGLLICARGLRARVKVRGETRWGRQPHQLAYVFALPDVAYVQHAAAALAIRCASHGKDISALS